MKLNRKGSSIFFSLSTLVIGLLFTNFMLVNSMHRTDKLRQEMRVSNVYLYKSFTNTIVEELVNHLVNYKVDFPRTMLLDYVTYEKMLEQYRVFFLNPDDTFKQIYFKNDLEAAVDTFNSTISFNKLNINLSDYIFTVRHDNFITPDRDSTETILEYTSEDVLAIKDFRLNVEAGGSQNDTLKPVDNFSRVFTVTGLKFRFKISEDKVTMFPDTSNLKIVV